MASDTALGPVQAAIYARAAGDTTLQVTLLGGTLLAPKTWDAPPANEPYPYTIIGDLAARRSDTLGRYARIIDVPLFALSRYEGNLQVQAIADRFLELFDDQPLTVTGWNHVATTFVRATPIRYGDGLTRILQVDFEVIVEAN